MPQNTVAVADSAAPGDLISFRKAIPDACSRHGVRYPQWFLLLVAVLGILSGSRDLAASLSVHLFRGRM